VSVVVIGLNHRTAPLELLERMAVADAQLPKALHDLTLREHLSEAVVLSTCNRVEVYAQAERFHGAYADVRNFLAELSFLPPEDFADHLYAHFDAEAVAHLFSVIAGLDSAVLGETEIQGQVRRAWERARDQAATGKTLNLLFRHAIEAGKRARSETTVARHITSVSQAAVAMAAERLGSLQDKVVLVVGAGDMGEGMASALSQYADVGEIRVANRTPERAQEMASRIRGRAVGLNQLRDELTDVDVVLTSTGSHELVIDEGDLAPVMAQRRVHPMLVVDIAVPRDVAPSVAAMDGVTLLDMEDVGAFAAGGRTERHRDVALVEEILAEERERYRDATSAQELAPAVVALRERAEALRVAELQRYRKRLGNLDSEQLRAVDALTKGLVAKLLHEPTVVLKDAGGSTRGDRLLTALRDLFEIDV
jgi:glutamyl-tRNA reductase